MLGHDWFYFAANPLKLDVIHSTMNISQRLQLLRDFISFSEASLMENQAKVNQEENNANKSAAVAGGERTPVSGNASPDTTSTGTVTFIYNSLNEMHEEATATTGAHSSSSEPKFEKHNLLDSLSLKLWAWEKFDLAFLRSACQPVVLHARLLQALMRAVGGEEAVKRMYGPPRWCVPEAFGGPATNHHHSTKTDVVSNGDSLHNNDNAFHNAMMVCSAEEKFVYCLYHRWAIQLQLYRSVIQKCDQPNACPVKKGFTELPDMLFFQDSLHEAENVLKRVPMSVDFLLLLLREEQDTLFDANGLSNSAQMYAMPHSLGFQIPHLASAVCVYRPDLTHPPVDSTLFHSWHVHLLIRLDIGRYFMQQKHFSGAFEQFKEMRYIIESVSSRQDLSTLNSIIHVDHIRQYLKVCEQIQQELTGIQLSSGSADPASFVFVSPSPTAEAAALVKGICENRNIDTIGGSVDRLVDLLMQDLLIVLHPGAQAVLQVAHLPSPISLGDRSDLEEQLHQWMITVRAKSFKKDRQAVQLIYLKILACNLLRRVVDGRAILSPFLQAITNMNDDVDSQAAAKQSTVVKQNAIKLVNFVLCQLARCLRTLESRESQKLSLPSFGNNMDTSAASTMAERMNLICFLWFLCQSLPWEWNFSNIMLNSDVVNFLNEEEICEFQAWSERNDSQQRRSVAVENSNCSNEDLEEELFLLDLEDDFSTWEAVEGVAMGDTEDQDDWYAEDQLYQETWDKTEGLLSLEASDVSAASITTSNTTASESRKSEAFSTAAAMGDCMRLLSSYDPEEITILVERLFNSHQWAAISQLREMSLCWRVVPASIAQPLSSNNYQNKCCHITAHILIAKALCLRQMQDWTNAKNLLIAAETQITDVYIVKKLIQFEKLLIDLEHAFLGNRKELFDPQSSIFNEVRRASMSCVTSLRTDSVNSVREEIILAVTCHLLALKDFEYLIKGSCGGSGVLEFGRHIAIISKDLSEGKLLLHQRDSHHVLSSSGMFWDYLYHSLIAPANVPTSSRRGDSHMMNSPRIQLRQVVAFSRLLRSPDHFDLLITSVAQLLNACRSDLNLQPTLGPFCNCWPTTVKVPDHQAIQLTELFRVLLDTALASVAYSQGDCERLFSWWLLRGDLSLAEMQFSHAFRSYLQALLVGTDCFLRLPSEELTSKSRVYENMMRCLEELGYHGQAIVLSQCVPQGAKSAAQLLKKHCIPLDSVDTYVDYLWDLNLIEILVAFEHKSGTPFRAKQLAGAISRVELNINNHDLILQEAIRKRKLEFFKVLTSIHLAV